MKLKLLGATLAIAALGVAALPAVEAEARHGRKAAIIAGAAVLGLGLAAAASRPRYYYDDYGYYDDYDYGPPPRRYYRAPPRGYYDRGYSSRRGYYDDRYAGPYDYPDPYAKEKIRRRHFTE